MKKQIKRYIYNCSNYAQERVSEIDHVSIITLYTIGNVNDKKKSAWYRAFL